MRKTSCKLAFPAYIMLCGSLQEPNNQPNQPLTYHIHLIFAGGVNCYVSRPREGQQATSAAVVIAPDIFGAQVLGWCSGSYWP